MDAAGQKRLWELMLHEVEVFNGRQGLVLVAESLLAVAYAGTYHTKDIAIAIAVAALGVTVAWLYVSTRHSRIVDCLTKRAKDQFPEFAEIYKEYREAEGWRQLRSRTVVAFVMPLILLAMWVFLLFDAALR